MTPTDRPSKQEAFLTFLEDGWVTVYVDARRPGVAVPPHLQNEARLVLQYGLNMPVPVENLEVTDVGIKARLSFARQPHDTLIPWSAVYVIACTDGRGVLYQEDVPPELIAAAAAETDSDAVAGTRDGDDAAESGERTPGEGRLTSIPDEATTAKAAEGAARPTRTRLKSVPMPDEAAAEEPAEPAASKGEDKTPPPDKPRGRPSLHLVK